MSDHPSGGLMQALAPIATRRPVHIVVSGGAERKLHVVCQPLRVGDEEDPEIARGFTVEATAEELDADLAGHVAERWVPAHQSLQSVFDQIAAHTEQTRQAALRKQKDGGKGKKDAGATGAQTTLTPPAAKAPAAPAAAPAAVPANTSADASSAGKPSPAPSPPESSGAPAPAEQPDAPVAAPPPAGDGISSLFD